MNGTTFGMSLIMGASKLASFSNASVALFQVVVPGCRCLLPLLACGSGNVRRYGWARLTMPANYGRCGVQIVNGEVGEAGVTKDIGGRLFVAVDLLAKQFGDSMI